MTIESSEPATAASRRGWLPAQASSFVGRERELAELEALFEEARLLTLTGTGGSGKTRLALELARRVSERLDEGAYFVDLAPITDPSLTASSIAATLGIRAKPRTPLIDTLADRFRQRSVLLVLDNLEQLPGAATVIGDLLTRCPNLQVLATSRTRLHLRGEHEYMVDPLGLPGSVDPSSPEQLGQTEAVRLFVERARAVASNFTLTGANGPAVAEICRRVDGLPLAIELAAAHSRLLGPEALLRRLDHPLSVLSAGAADAPGRQRTLRDTIAWSHDLLEPPDRTLLARLSVFVGGFTVPTAEAVVPDPGDPPAAGLLEPLGRLADHNLLRVAPDAEGEPRFTLLETIREFAHEQLSSADAEALRGRHAAHFAGLAQAANEGWGGVDSSLWYLRVTDEMDNLRAALAWAWDRGAADLLLELAVALWGFLVDRGDHTEAGRWLQAAEAIASKAEPQLRARLYERMATHELRHAGDRALANKLVLKSLRLYEALGDAAGMAWSLFRLAEVAADLGRRPMAARRLEDALSVTRTVLDHREQARLLGAIAVEHGIAQSIDVRALATEAVERGELVGDTFTVSLGRVALGLAALKAGDAAAAVQALSVAASMLDEIGFHTDVAWALAGLTTARLRAGEPMAARFNLKDTLRRADEIGIRWIEMSALEAAADWLGAIGDPERAAVCWAAFDEAQRASLDRTPGSNLGLFVQSRERDRSALAAATFARASAAGRAMSLTEALRFAIDAVDEAVLDDERSDHPDRHGRHDLTAREREVLELLAAGRSDGQIAEILFISKKTAAVHVANIKGKLGAGSRVEIAITAQRDGLVAGSRETSRSADRS